MPKFEIRTMTRSEVDLAVEWAALEGWNPGLDDATCFFNTDPQGFLLGLLDGQPIGCISAVSYAATFGFLGFYIVLPAYRGQGYGIRLWRSAMTRLSGHQIGLDGVVAQQDNYRKSGFNLAYRNIRYAASGLGHANSTEHPQLRPIAETDFPLIAAYDRAFFPASRTEFLHGWLQLPASKAYVWMKSGQLQGWGLIRKCRQGYKIGPLFADHALIADALYTELSAEIPEHETIYLDIPESNPAALALTQRHAMYKVFETARMYTGDFPKLSIDRLYGVTSFELG
jgi:ribosomal protein S18 acetylase RimI-like enzyme